ncbi:MAG: HPF/RaiA family ribosome-associated protein [Candidatus Gracilibacteria bacterium]|jgi:ribosomal subunit interface protein
MQPTFFYKNLADPEKELVESYFQKKAVRLEKLLSKYDADGVKLNVTGERFTRKAAYKVEMVMDLPKVGGKPLYSSEDSRDLRKAIDLSVDKLIDQIKKVGERAKAETKKNREI